MASALQISRRCSVRNSISSKNTRRECQEEEMHFVFLFRSFSFDLFSHLRADEKDRRRRIEEKKNRERQLIRNPFMRDVR